MSQTRRLAAILAADEGGTLERLRALRRELLDPKIAKYRGRLVKTTGDGLLVEFGSVVDGCGVPSRCSARCPGATPACRPTTASSRAPALMSAISWSRTATSLAMASMSRHVSKLALSPVGFAFQHSYKRMPRHMGRLDEARDAVMRLRALTPVVVPSATQFRNPEHRQLLLSGLRLAATEAT